MQTSRAPSCQASAAFSPTCSGVRKYVSDSRGPRLKAQNLQPTKQMLVKLTLRLTTYVTRLPASSERSRFAAHRSPSKRSPPHSARVRDSSNERGDPFGVQ